MTKQEFELLRQVFNKMRREAICAMEEVYFSTPGYSEYCIKTGGTIDMQNKTLTVRIRLDEVNIEFEPEED